ncbi:gastrula zinc finger protein XlCGF48.2-like [Bombina bombina]|uniref:gastrula zinc finger protein XlCGF48.2-like n=1 Tax=Bombina bombina TaxID=8345 RepID=UPI00235AE058|nr:gastrula zinc finger protein XlCGF48.2-like [Bombina bombina]
MSDNTENQTSDLPDAHGDTDNVDIGTDEIPEDLCVRRQLGPTDEETSDSISSGLMDVTSSDGSADEYREEPNMCDQVKTEEDEVPTNTATDADNADIVKVETTEDLCVRRQLGPTDEETSGSISSGLMDVTSSDGSADEYREEPNMCDQVKTEEDEVPTNTATGNFTNCNADASFRRLQNQRNHLENVCSECGKCFTTKSSLIRHQKVHTGEQTFSCPDCEKCFSLKSHLIAHQKIHTKERGFLCSDCEKCFTTKSSLIRHQKIHKVEKEFLCSECGKCFTQKSHLIRHQKSHTGDKAFSCSECGKCFTLKSTLNNHRKIHTGEKEFSCSKCGKSFTQQSTLINHQKVHIKENQRLISEAQMPTQSSTQCPEC